MVLADVVGGWDDVEVGYLLGRGSSGSVYRARWNGKHVAVKVCVTCFQMHICVMSYWLHGTLNSKCLVRLSSVWQPTHDTAAWCT